MQTLNTMTISTEAEFKAECIANGDKAITLLKYLQKELHESIFLTPKSSDREKIFHKYNNVGELIKTIENARHESAPQLNI
ncbi:hypothetical protein OH773_06730 [Buttiauxella sp. WJP83]|uniref:hypothetical protein n=1 Tax=Buttiauxella sp. WJP83 TaxID=2986951 RepID=UPI0022DE8844|nr:hypothetical protein [Buttiauxella sp. WJP83]WBM71930.1 hypothetical protein OH773_06730 [Buttiauxella sp. WJP83]